MSKDGASVLALGVFCMISWGMGVFFEETVSWLEGKPGHRPLWGVAIWRQPYTW